MPNIATLLKNEISRVARKIVRSEVAALKKAAIHSRGELAVFKRRIAELEKQAVQLRKMSASKQISSESPTVAASSGFKFSAAKLGTQRTRLGLTLKQTGFLLNSSPLTVSRWEDKTSGVTPRAKYLPAMAAFHNLNREQAQTLVLQFGI